MRALLLPISIALLKGCSDGEGPETSSSSGAGGAASSAVTTTVAASTGTGTGGEAEWTLVPWHSGRCQFEYAKKPEAGFPKLEWTTCPGGEMGCERLVRNWPSDTLTGLAAPAIRRSGSGYALAMYVAYPELEKRIVFVDPAGVAVAAYKTVPGTGCLASGPGWSEAGHWIGVQEIALPQPASYVFQPTGQPAEAAEKVPITWLSNNQRGNDELFNVVLDLSKAIHLFDRSTGQLHVSPASLLGVDRPRLLDDAALFLAYPGYNKPEAWVWSRAGGYQSLVDRNPNHVVDVNSDGQTLVWIQTPPKADADPWPAGTLHTAPYTTVAADVVGTPRRPLPQVEPGWTSAMGAGYYAVFSAEAGLIHVVRVSDAHLWTLPVPVDEWRAKLDEVTYIDDTYLFFKTETTIYRQRLDALGPGSPAN